MLSSLCSELVEGHFRVDSKSRIEPFCGDMQKPPFWVLIALRIGFVQTYDEKPRRRLWELMKSQGMQENQQVVFMSDGGENVRRVQEYLHPYSEHLIDWFHITMRLTVLQQQ